MQAQRSRILVLCRHALGDIVLVRPIYEHLRAWRPDAWIIAGAYPDQVPWLVLHPEIDQTVVIPRHSLTSRRSRGWLRLLAQDVGGQRFQWTGLKLVAAAQWALKDYEGARDTLEKVPANLVDAATNLMLANLYERLYRESRKPELLTLSDQAIQRVVGDGGADRRERVEAHALKARNAKTRWREEFEKGWTRK